MEAAHCIRANTHRQQTSCMCDISCGVCLSLSLWVGVNVHIICVCLYICILHSLITVDSVQLVFYPQILFNCCGVHASEWVTQQLRPVCLT